MKKYGILDDMAALRDASLQHESEVMEILVLKKRLLRTELRIKEKPHFSALLTVKQSKQNIIEVTKV